MVSTRGKSGKVAQAAERSGDGQATEPLRRGASGAVTIRDLFAYRLHVVANSISRSAATRYRREFDVTLGEWRSIALLAGFGPLGLNQLARQAGVDRGQISRIVAGLTARGLISRSHGSKGKPVSLVLTAKGKELFDGLFNAALDRDEVFLGALAEGERRSFERMLNKMFAVARQVEEIERSKSASTDPMQPNLHRDAENGVDSTTPKR